MRSVMVALSVVLALCACGSNAHALGCGVVVTGSYQFVGPVLEVVRNGGGEGAWNDRVDGWDRWAPGSDAEEILTRDVSTAGSGMASLRIAQPRADRPARWLQEIGAPASDVHWRLAAQFRGKLEPGSRAYVRCTDARRPEPLAELSATDLSVQWKGSNAQLSVPPGAERLRLTLGIEGAGEVWFDEVSIRPSDETVEAVDEVELVLPLPGVGTGQRPLSLVTHFVPPVKTTSGKVERADDGTETIRMTVSRECELTWIRWSVLMIVAGEDGAGCPPATAIVEASALPEEVLPYMATDYLVIPPTVASSDDQEKLEAVNTYADLAQYCEGVLCSGRRPSPIEGSHRWRDAEGYELGPLEVMAAICRLRGVPARIVTVVKGLPAPEASDNPMAPLVQRVEVWTSGAGWVPFPDVGNEERSELWVTLGVRAPGKEARPDPLREGRPLLMAGGKVITAPLMDRGEAMAGWLAVNIGGPVLSVARVEELGPGAATWWQRSIDTFIAGQVPAPAFVSACQCVERASTLEELAKNLEK